MSCTVSPSEKETGSGSHTLRILYAACGLVYRSGCGPSEHVLSLARELGNKKGVSLCLLFAHAGDPVPDGPYEVELLGDCGIEPCNGRETDSLVLGIDPLRYDAHKRLTLAFLSRHLERFDILVERMWGYGGILAGAFEKAGRVVVIEENGPISWKGSINKPGDLLRLIYLLLSRARLKRIYRKARAVVVQTPNLADRLSREFNVPEERLEIVPNGVDLSRFLSTAPHEKTPAKGRLILLYSGSLDSSHDLRPLLHAFREWDGNAEIRILGSGPMREELSALARSLPGDRVRLLGRVHPEEVVKQIEESDLCVAPYSIESNNSAPGFQYSPLKLMEYAAGGRAIAVAGAPTGTGPVKQGVNGFFIRNNAKDWVSLFEKLPGRAALSEMGWMGRELVRNRGWDKTAVDYLDLISSLAEKTVVAPLPFRNPENRYIDALHKAIDKTEVRLVDPGHMSFMWLFRNAGYVDIIHIHWPESHFQFPGRAYSIMKWLYLMARLKAARLLGYKLVWTAHNINAHDKRYAMLDNRLRRLLLAQAHTILLGKASLIALEKRFKTAPRPPSAIIRHGNYADCYGSMLTKAEARKKLGLPENKTVYLSIGTLRRYKGLGRLARVLSSIGSIPDITWIVAGKVSDRAVVEEISEPFKPCPERLNLYAGFVPDEKVGVFLAASDFVVLPYSDMHMSGVLMLALSFEKPVIAPDKGLVREYLPEGAGILYNPDDPEGIEKAIEQSADLDPGEMGKKGREFALSLSWDRIAAEHARFYSRLGARSNAHPVHIVQNGQEAHPRAISFDRSSSNTNESVQDADSTYHRVKG